MCWRRGGCSSNGCSTPASSASPRVGVVDALRGYRNADGGFGHGLEPDKRCPASLPIDVEVALKTLVAAGADDDGLVLGACDYLARVAEDVDHGGAVPLAFPVIEDYPRAEHWTDWTYAPGLNPTAGLVGWLYRLGVEHPWVEAATTYCWQALESGGGRGDVHDLSESLIFLAHVPTGSGPSRRDRAACNDSTTCDCSTSTPPRPRYGLTPLHLAPTPESPWREYFSDERSRRTWTSSRPASRPMVAGRSRGIRRARRRGASGARSGRSRRSQTLRRTAGSTRTARSGAQTPVVPSTRSRTRSACPL